MVNYKSKLTDEQIVEYYKTMSISAVSVLNGTSSTTVNRKLHRLGVRVRGRGRNEISKTWVSHGFCQEAIKLGVKIVPYIRAKALVFLGGKCANCGCADLRVLELNHINGESKNKKINPSQRVYAECLKILKGNATKINVLCANCNILHEYERGNRNDMRAYMGSKI